MKGLAIILVVIVVIAVMVWVAVALVEGWQRAGRKRERERAERLRAKGWKVEVDTDGGYSVVSLVRHGERPERVGTVPLSLPHYQYDDQLTQLRLEAQAKADAMNRDLD